MMRGAFAGKEIVLGVTGSIAAYKACELASRLKEHGATVRAVLSRAALSFVGPASLEGITGQPVITEMFDPVQNPEIEHIAVARRADLFLIAPATANVIAKAAHGIADDWLTTTLLATRSPILFAPAMNSQMYLHPATQANIELLSARGCHFVGPGAGQLACGEVGPGRLIEPIPILEAAAALVCGVKDLVGKHVLITSGANHEPIDPVRFIGNRSSGKMGHALALEALRRGARVTVICGPSEVMPPHAAQTVRVETAREMFGAVEARFAEADVFVAAAAVADYRVDMPRTEKHKRTGASQSVTLVPNPDIAAEMGRRKRKGQVMVGFAAETNDFVAHAEEKLTRKNLDLIVANQVGVADSGFGTDTNRAWLVARGRGVEDLGMLSKEALAGRIFDVVAGTLAGA